MPRPTAAGRAAAGRAVRAWRANETQAEVAARAGIDTDTLGSLEAGTKWPWNRTLRAVERALGQPPGELDRIAATGGEVTERSPPRESATPGGLRAAIYDELPPDRARRVAELVEAELAGEPLPEPRPSGRPGKAG